MLPHVNIWFVYAGTIAVLLLAVVAGYRMGVAARLPDGDASNAGASGPLLALLGLFLAFTFAMASARFDTRKVLLIDEANAIGTAYLRSGLLAEPLRSQARDLLRSYVDLRMEAVRTGRVQEAITRSDRIQGVIWSMALLHAERNPTPPAALFVQPVNDVIDMQGKRVSLGWQNTIPRTILYALYVLAVLALGVMGFEGGLRGPGRFMPTIVFVLMVATVITLIVDLDRPGEGLIQVSQQAMTDLRAGMGP
jgi:hypothetical protein